MTTIPIDEGYCEDHPNAYLVQKDGFERCSACNEIVKAKGVVQSKFVENHTHVSLNAIANNDKVIIHEQRKNPFYYCANQVTYPRKHAIELYKMLGKWLGKDVHHGD